MGMHYVEPNRMDSFEFYFIILHGVVIRHYSMTSKLEHTPFMVGLLKECAE